MWTSAPSAGQMFGAGAAGSSAEASATAADEPVVSQSQLRSWVDAAASQFREDARRKVESLRQRAEQVEDAPAVDPATYQAEIERAVDRFGQRMERNLGATRRDGVQTREEVRQAIQSARDLEFAHFEKRVEAISRGRRPPERLDEPADYVGVVREIFVERNTIVDWSALLASIAVGVFVGAALAAMLRRMANRLETRGRSITASTLNSFALPVNLALTLVGLGVGLQWIWAPAEAKEVAALVVKLLVALAIFWALWKGVADFTRMVVWASSKTQSALDEQITLLIRKTLRLFLIVVFVLYVISEIFNQDITGFLAGLGIAGLAISLAAQDSLKNLFGSFTIYADRPFRLGEAVRYAGHFGAIETIGFRSTKMRTFEGHLITIPNSQIVNEVIENVGARPYIRRWFTLGVTYDTPPEKLRRAVQIIRETLEGHENSHPDFPPRVHFYNYGAYSLDILVVYFFFPNDWWAFVEFSERFNLTIFDRFNEEDIDFAFPTSTVHVAGDEKRRLTLNMLGADLRSHPQRPDGEQEQ